MRQHPYLGLPETRRWDRAVARGFDVTSVYSGAKLVRANERIMTAGSCFAANIVPYLERAGLSYLRTEPHPSIISERFKDAFAYDGMTARYGNIYTPRQLLQLLQRCVGEFSPREDRWYAPDKVIDPYRPALKYPARSDAEFDLLTRHHLDCVRRGFEEADVFIFTLGLTEAWCSALDGAVFPACPGTVAGEFDPDRHVFTNFGVMEVAEDLGAFIRRIRQMNPRLRIILTVSPVALVATQEPQHVLQSTLYSKSVLRVAADMVCRSFEDCLYFPSYEIVSGPQAPWTAFKEDRRSPSGEIIDEVMRCFFAHCEAQDGGPIRLGGETPSSLKDAAEANLSARLVKAECEEEAVLRE